MAWNDYITAVNGGDTGTYDPSAAGLSGGSESALTEPILSQLIRAGFLKNGISGPPPESARINAAPPAPPPIPSHEDLASFAQPQAQPQPSAPNLMSGGGGMPRVLAQLPSAQPTPAPGGDMSMQQAGVNLLGQPTPGSPYANIRAAAPQAQPAAAPPTAAPATNYSPGARASQFATRIDNSPLTNYAPPPSTKPGFYDNLMRFGLAAMQAGGKPGSTLLGALGEAGLSTYDANQKATQTDIENDQNARKTGIQGKGLVAKAYETVDTLEQRSHDRTLAAGAQMQSAQDSRELKAAIASGNQALIQQKIDEIARHNSELESTRQQAADTNAGKAAEAAQANADKYEGSYRKSLDTGMSGMTMTDAQKDLMTMSRTAARHPGSTQAQAWTDRKTDVIADAKAAIAKGADPKAVLSRVQGFGLTARDLQ